MQGSEGRELILVEVYVAALDERYDFELDENVEIRQVTGEICEMLSKKTKEPLPARTEDFMLCSIDNEEVLAGEKTLYQSHIRDGSHLILV